ncbi:hypothetical protein F5880DRAFT_1477285 [Lentinula raphanica]|nr:hypothetical protein F5880DRAFT_1477285 [Lentinula raphanica]
MSDNPTNPFVNEWIIAANQSPYRASPSMFGVLPATDSTTAGFQHFSFTGMNPNILNSTLSKGDGQPQYFITTHTTTPGYTILTNVQGRNEVLIEWSHGCAMVEIAGALQKQYASMFLQLSPDRRFRIMNFAGDRYAWMARDKNICVREAQSKERGEGCLAQICKEEGIIRIEISPIAISRGLLAPVALSTILLQSGRVID